ncbi:MAG TPA: VWA domain-containing protein [Actinomycetes bacterium]|nr:VWA domain-containing protein [Actinomycetes bacterium]
MDHTTDVLVGFARTLRNAGVVADTTRLHAFLTALDQVDVSRRRDVYWTGRITLCGRHEDLDRYDRAFDAYFRGEHGALRLRQRPSPMLRHVSIAIPGDDEGSEGEEREDVIGAASRAEVLRHRDLATLTPDEREEVRRLVAALNAAGPMRRARRRHPSARGAVDAPRTVRATLKHGGEPLHLHRHRPGVTPRRLVMVLDVSGSMSPYADAYLRFAHAAVRRRRRTEVFTLGTRLTRVTRELRGRDPNAALATASAAVPDWSGGTRLGELMRAFLDRWGQRGTARGAVVVIASDGWERGDPVLLGAQMARLSRLAHRIVWVNPHRGKSGYAPLAGGMAAALPYVDDFVAGHTLATLEQLAELLSREERHA